MQLTLPLAALLLGASTVAALPGQGPGSPDPVNDLVVVSSNTAVGRRNLVERRTCYNTGSTIGRDFAYAAIDAFCKSVMGKTTTPGVPMTGTYTWSGGSETMFISAAPINGCTFKVDDNCNKLLQDPIMNCNVDGPTNTTQGGYWTDSCGQWTADPGSDGSRI
ncbi:hypothetical protein BD410DRAFT_805857 [Rickenella mellea]|uniref:Uncharacterized protein n=1 Tax=Rickenella mellea TaxID=50990 RepID=A0A4Y7PV04_9AGAM|nr:hypothetical protein BD410DRAFT_805857 [Rickenella mellea]